MGSYELPLIRSAALRFVRSEGNSVLDVGCGFGHIASKFTEAGKTVVGIDISLETTITAKTKKIYGLVLARADHLPFRDKSFDLVMSITTLQHIQNESEFKQSLHEICRTSRQQVLLIESITEKAPSYPDWWWTFPRPVTAYSDILKEQMFNEKHWGLDSFPARRLLLRFRRFVKGTTAIEETRSFLESKFVSETPRHTRLKSKLYNGLLGLITCLSSPLDSFLSRFETLAELSTTLLFLGTRS